MIDSCGEPFYVTISRQIRIKCEKTAKNWFAKACKDRTIGQRSVDADRFFYYYLPEYSDDPENFRNALKPVYDIQYTTVNVYFTQYQIEVRKSQ